MPECTVRICVNADTQCVRVCADGSNECWLSLSPAAGGGDEKTHLSRRLQHCVELGLVGQESLLVVGLQVMHHESCESRKLGQVSPAMVLRLS